MKKYLTEKGETFVSILLLVAIGLLFVYLRGCVKQFHEAYLLTAVNELGHRMEKDFTETQHCPLDLDKFTEKNTWQHAKALPCNFSTYGSLWQKGRMSFGVMEEEDLCAVGGVFNKGAYSCSGFVYILPGNATLEPGIYCWAADSKFCEKRFHLKQTDSLNRWKLYRMSDVSKWLLDKTPAWFL